MGYTIWPDGYTGDALQAIYKERNRQEQLRAEGKFPHTCASPNGLTEAEKLGVLAEEFGEVAQHVCKYRVPNPTPEALARAATITDDDGQRPIDRIYRKPLREELVQVAAVCVAWIEALDAESTKS